MTEAAFDKTKKAVPDLVSPWVPISDALDLKHLGKLGEELNECGSATARCIIQGVDGTEPVTGKVNRRWLEEEIADVLANVELVTARFGLDREFIERRIARKKVNLGRWFMMGAQ